MGSDDKDAVNWKGTWPAWDYQPPFVFPKDKIPREMDTHDDLGYRIADREREPGDDG